MFPKDNYKDLIAFYGNPDPDGDGVPSPVWERDNLVNVVCPWQMYLAWDPSKKLTSIRIHKKCAKSLEDTLQDIWLDFSKQQERIEAGRLHLFGGSYSFRRARGLVRLSTHSFGCALDLDPENNPLGKKWVNGGKMLPIAGVNRFRNNGWAWGGTWRRPDAMHFQAAVV